MKVWFVVLAVLAAAAHALGGAGDDFVRGGPGRYTIEGQAGNDVLRGRPGDDVVNGGDGNDRIWVGSGADIENGGDGNDVMHALAPDNQVDRVDCGPGDDVAYENASEHDVFVNCEKVITLTVTPKQAAEDDK